MARPPARADVARLVGRVQKKGEATREIRPGDRVFIVLGEMHWHGAAHGHTMVHLALYERDEKGVDAIWREHVTDEEYTVSSRTFDSNAA